MGGEALKKRLKKKLDKKNKLIANEISAKMIVDEDKVLTVKGGIVQIDFDDPKRVETYEKWIED